MPQINRAQFLATLETVQPGLSLKDVIQQSSSFVFTGGYVVTFNDEVSCRTKSGLDADFTGAVAADPLLKVLRQLKDDELQFTEGDGRFILRGKRKEVWVRMDAEIVLPIELVEKPTGWQDLPQDFGDAIKHVQEAAGSNEEEFMTVCLHFTPKYIEACDRFEACRYSIKVPITEDFLVRRNSIKHIAQLGMTRIAETESWVHTKNPSGLYFSCRRHTEEYPDLSPQFDFKGEPTVLPTAAEDAAKLAAVFSAEDKDDDKVVVEMSEGWMKVIGEGQFGGAQQDLKIAYHGKPFQFRISPTLLIELVTQHKDCEISPTRLKVEGERWVYVTGLGKPRKKGERTEQEPEAVAAGVGSDGDTEAD